jgi:hypothetical protein
VVLVSLVILVGIYKCFTLMLSFLGCVIMRVPVVSDFSKYLSTFIVRVKQYNTWSALVLFLMSRIAG